MRLSFYAGTDPPEFTQSRRGQVVPALLALGRNASSAATCMAGWEHLDELHQAEEATAGVVLRDQDDAPAMLAA